MCHYSLECVKNRDAVVGERLRTRRFQNGSLGFASPEEPDVAVCIKEGIRLLLRDVPERLRAELRIGTEAIGTFGMIEKRRRWWDIWTLSGDDRDALFFASGTSILLSRLPEQLVADVIGYAEENPTRGKSQDPILTPIP